MIFLIFLKIKLQQTQVNPFSDSWVKILFTHSSQPLADSIVSFLNHVLYPLSTTFIYMNIYLENSWQIFVIELIRKIIKVLHTLTKVGMFIVLKNVIPIQLLFTY